MSPPSEIPDPAGWALYDDSCGFCRRWVLFWNTTLRKRGFSVAPLQAQWVQEKLCTSPEQLLYDFRLLLVNGEQIHGADAYRYLMRRIWWALPFYLLSTAPLLRSAFDLGYRSLADNRTWVSHACGLSSAPEGGDCSTDGLAIHAASGRPPAVSEGEPEAPQRATDEPDGAD